MTTFASSVGYAFTGGGNWGPSYYYKLDLIDSNNYAHFEMYNTQNNLQHASHGIRFYADATVNKTKLLVNGDDNTFDPSYIVVTDTSGNSTSLDVEAYVDVGYTVYLKDSNGNNDFIFTVGTQHLWSFPSSGGATAPTSYAITSGAWSGLSFTPDDVSPSSGKYQWDMDNQKTGGSALHQLEYIPGVGWFCMNVDGTCFGDVTATSETSGSYINASGGTTTFTASSNQNLASSNNGVVTIIHANGGNMSFNEVDLFTNGLPSSSSGSSGNRQTLSGGTTAEIINVEFTKLSDSEVEVSFDYQNINSFTMFRKFVSNTPPSYNVWSNMGGSGSSGTWSGGGAFLQSMNEGEQIWVVGSTDANGDMPVYTHKFIEWELDKTSTPHQMKAKAFFTNNGGNGFGFNADVGLHVSGPGVTDGIDDTQIYSGNEEEMEADLVYGTLYKVLKPDNSQYGKAYQYGKISKSGGSHNFW